MTCPKCDTKPEPKCECGRLRQLADLTHRYEVQPHHGGLNRAQRREFVQRLKRLRREQVA